ncbi:MAG: NAD(P) transhydrogenase subunit alpha [Pirellulales bacterium]
MIRITTLLLVLFTLCFSSVSKPAFAGEVLEVEDSKPVPDSDSSADNGFSRTDALVASLTIFILAIFIGFELITKVPPTLHTPLMSASNAISGVSIVGALFAAGTMDSNYAAFFGFIAVVLATLNVVGGYLVTHRMLEMFRPKK